MAEAKATQPHSRHIYFHLLALLRENFAIRAYHRTVTIRKALDPLRDAAAPICDMLCAGGALGWNAVVASNLLLLHSSLFPLSALLRRIQFDAKLFVTLLSAKHLLNCRPSNATNERND